MSKAWQTRPSEFYFIRDEVTAWCFDRAVTTFGMAVEDDITTSTRKAKTDKAAQATAQRVLQKWLRAKGDTKGMFRDPFAK